MNEYIYLQVSGISSLSSECKSTTSHLYPTYAFGRLCSTGIYQTHPSDCQIVKWDSSLQRGYFHCSTVQWWCTPLHPMLEIAHCDLYLMCICSAMETHCKKFLMHSYFGGVASRGSVELCSE